jgi:hypothetical protein
MRKKEQKLEYKKKGKDMKVSRGYRRKNKREVGNDRGAPISGDYHYNFFFLRGQYNSTVSTE